MNDSDYMQQALALAKTAAAQQEVPVGAVLVLGEEIIGRGFNQPITRKDPTAHAEILALRDAAKTVGNYRLPHTVLYVTLEPCLMCIGAIIHARIDRLVYAASDPKVGATQYLPARVAQVGGILSSESSILLKQFFENRRN